MEWILLIALATGQYEVANVLEMLDNAIQHTHHHELTLNENAKLKHLSNCEIRISSRLMPRKLVTIDSCWGGHRYYIEREPLYSSAKGKLLRDYSSWCTTNRSPSIEVTSGPWTDFNRDRWDYEAKAKKSVEIRLSDLPAEIKGRQLAALITPGMPIDMACKLLGESPSLISGFPQRADQLIDMRYRLALYLNSNGNVLYVKARKPGRDGEVEDTHNEYPSTAWDFVSGRDHRDKLDAFQYFMIGWIR